MLSVSACGLRWLTCALSGLAAVGAGAQSMCDKLAENPALAKLSVTVTNVGTGQVATPVGGAAVPVAPDHCRLIALAQPVAGSRIAVEVWLPAAAQWNGKLLGTGNGGYSSTMSTGLMADGLRRGYAVAGSDTGHQGDDIAFGAGNPEKIRDWAYRAEHEMAEAAKEVVAAYYGHAPQHAYFSGCSTGGQQALSEAQRYPDDFDGIIAGDPGHDRVALLSTFLWSWQVTHPDGEESFPASKLPLLAKTVMDQCDALDGVRDGIIADPRQCRPDLKAVLCAGADQTDCLTSPEVHQAEQLYAGPRDGAGYPLFANWQPGSELGWTTYFIGHDEPMRLPFWRLWVYGNPQWGPKDFNFVRDRDAAREKLPWVDATAPDLSAFRKRGGKLLMYHGWADPITPPGASIDYYNAVRAQMGNEPDSFMRLFMVPGMSHCTGGPGTSAFDTLGALDLWVTRGIAPDRIEAAHKTPEGKVDRTRSLCAYPQRAVWDGVGNPDEAGSFACRAPNVP